MVVPKINSSHGSETRNIINAAIDSINAQGKTIQNLVAEGQLTEEQYGNLINIVNGMLKSGEVGEYDLTPELRLEVNKISDKINKGEVTASDITGTLQSLVYSIPNKINNGEVKLDDLDPSVLEAINNGDGTPFEILSIPRNGSVTVNKTNFLTRSTNLFNMSDVTLGKSLNSADSEVENELFGYSGYVDVSNIKDITALGVVRINTYNEKLTLQSSYGMNQTDVYHLGVSNVDYIRVVFEKRKLGEIQINVGTELLEYEPYYITFRDDANFKSNKVIRAEDTDFIEYSSNIFNDNDVVLGEYVNATGTLVSDELFGYSNYIDVSSIENIAHTGLVRLNLFNGSKSPIGSNGYIQSEINTANLENVHYIRAVFEVNKLGAIQINAGLELLPYEPYYMRLKNGSAEPTDPTPLRNREIITQRLFYDTTKVAKPDLATFPLGDMIALYDDLVASYPDYVSLIDEINDPDGNPIKAYSFKINNLNPKTSKKMYINTGTHGGERASIWVMYQMMKDLCENWLGDPVLEELKTNVHFVIIPIANPFSYIEYTNGVSVGRHNKNGVDLPRNFPATFPTAPSVPGDTTYRGESVLSEVEAQFAYDIYKSEKWDYVTDFHNFFRHTDTKNFIWLGGTDEYTRTLSDEFIRKISIKWKKDIDYLPKNADINFGYTSINRIGIHHEAYVDGITSTLTEVCNKVELEDGKPAYSADTLTMGTETIVNWLYHVYLNI